MKKIFLIQYKEVTHNVIEIEASSRAEAISMLMTDEVQENAEQVGCEPIKKSAVMKIEEYSLEGKLIA